MRREKLKADSGKREREKERARQIKGNLKLGKRRAKGPP
jgi:hypothetical protein